ncbi:hypothetical protein AB0425_36630 [Actinosynnema sp. NPDC051121]|nr:hypothetical protein [Saccharothrix sp.]
MRITSRRLFGAAALLALGATGLLGGTASASPGGPQAPQPGDTRAVIGEQKNVDIDQQGNACEVVGLPGDEREMPAGTFTEEGVNIDITANPEGYVVTGVVVKGSSAYNVYAADKLGDLPWLDLHPPLNSSGGPAGISHWFVCVEKVEVTTTTTTPATTTDSTSTTTEATPTTTTESVATSPTSTTTPAAVAGADNDNLANTGFNGGWLLVVGLALVAAGAAFVASPKLRHLIRR